MRLPRLLLLPFLAPLLSSSVFAQPQAASSDEFDEVDHTPPQTIILHRWPISTSPNNDNSQIPIGTIRYSLNSRKGIYNPINVETEAQSDEYYRVGMLKGGKWVGGVARGSDLQNGLVPEITLRVDEEGEVWNVGYSASKPSPDKVEIQPVVHVVTTEAGAEPHLNRPIVLTAEGKLPEKPEEKTFFQKYWYLILGGMILLLAGGGDAK